MGFKYCVRCEKYKPEDRLSPKGVCWGCLTPSERIASGLEAGRISLNGGNGYGDMKLAQKAYRAILEHGGVVAAADALGVNHGVISKAKRGIATPAALEAFDLPPRTVEVSPDLVNKRPRRPDKETRCRIAADVSEAQRAALHRLAADAGGWSAWCRQLAEAYIKEESDAATRKPAPTPAESP